MNIGATKREVQESKLKDPNKFDDNLSRGDYSKTIYYYKDPKSRPVYSSVYVPIENYSNNLIFLLDRYMRNIGRKFDADKGEVITTLRTLLFPNKKDFKTQNPTESVAVWEIVRQYTRCIMQTVGKLAECVLIDNCANNSDVNKICINIALFKDEILETYDIPYEEYVAYSTSYQYVIYRDLRDGIYKAKRNYYYNPHHTSMDIGWCKRDNIWDQLRTQITELKYADVAKLQVKATLNCDNLDLDNYLLTPVIVFDYDHGISKLKNRYPHHVIYSANSLFPEIALEMEKYFQIIAAYVSGLTNKININETDLKNDKRLQNLFNISAYAMTKKDRTLDRMGLIKLAQDAGKPVILRA